MRADPANGLSDTLPTRRPLRWAIRRAITALAIVLLVSLLAAVLMHASIDETAEANPRPAAAAVAKP
ncbi:MAG: hypothetical protein KDJ41_07915 [Hyphomicrobiaceae bacterium]|nr:hypothetical protein [Hyphomicrobiaceae bacterium]